MTTPRTIPVAGLVEFAAVLLGLILITVGVWVELGWGWGLAAMGASVLVAVKWDGKRPQQ